MLEQNFYEVLEVEPSATVQDIDRAYRIARATYQPTSTATYSLFSEDENADILRRIEEAYAVLSDPRMRQEYDTRLQRELVRAQEVQGERAEAQPEIAIEAAGPAETEVVRAEPAPTPPMPLPPSPPTRAGRSVPAPALEFTMDLDEPELPDDGVFDGRVLRQLRIRRGLELDEISQVTKISELYLAFIEEDRFEDLPADVYLRGFLREYAKCLNLDPKPVVESYMSLCRSREPRSGTA